MSDSIPEFSVDDIEPYVPKSAAQVQKSVERRRKTVANELSVRPELTSRQQLGNRIFFYTLMCALSWASLFLSWHTSRWTMDGYQVNQATTGFDATIEIARQPIPIWTIAALVSLGTVMCLTNFLKLTGLLRRYIFASLGTAAALTIISLMSSSYGSEPGPGLWLMLITTISVLSYSWTNRQLLR